MHFILTSRNLRLVPPSFFLQLPYLVANVIEIIDPYIDPDEDGSTMDANAANTDKGVVVKTSTRQTVFLPIPGLVKASEMKPGELVGTNKDSYIILGMHYYIITLFLFVFLNVVNTPCGEHAPPPSSSSPQRNSLRSTIKE